MPRCEVVIVNFNAGDFLKDAVGTALRSAAVQRVVVVDNASADGSLNALGPDPRLVIIRNDSNLGFAAACNMGLESTTAENVLLLNPDCYILEPSIERLLTALDRSNGVAMAGPLLLSTNGLEQHGGRGAAPTLWSSLARAFGLRRWDRWLPVAISDFLAPRGPLPKVPIEVESISGACMVVRRDAMKEIGLLDQGYFLYCEDVDWCRRFRQRGWKILFVPDAKVIHHKGVSSRQTPFAAEWYKHSGMARFYSKFLRKQHSLPITALVFAGIWIRFGCIAAWLLLTSAFRGRAGYTNPEHAQSTS